MSSPFVAEIRIFAGNFAPRAWALCNGQIMSISQNTALFSLLGTRFGGDGKSTFALPDLRGAVPMHWGNGAGLTPRDLGETGGDDTVTLELNQMPAHTHTLQADTLPATLKVPAAGQSALARGAGGDPYTDATGGTLTPLALGALSGVGEGQPHNNIQPSLVLNFIISLQGIFPPRG